MSMSREPLPTNIEEALFSDRFLDHVLKTLERRAEYPDGTPGDVSNLARWDLKAAIQQGLAHVGVAPEARPCSPRDAR
jgi:hypothetical protein